MFQQMDDKKFKNSGVFYKQCNFIASLNTSEALRYQKNFHALFQLQYLISWGKTKKVVRNKRKFKYSK